MHARARESNERLKKKVNGGEYGGREQKEHASPAHGLAPLSLAHAVSPPSCRWFSLPFSALRCPRGWGPPRRRGASGPARRHAYSVLALRAPGPLLPSRPSPHFAVTAATGSRQTSSTNASSRSLRSSISDSQFSTASASSSSSSSSNASSSSGCGSILLNTSRNSTPRRRRRPLALP
ncbi:uncharacterized protein Tco025E_08699, partial [Trypanosoma conorhini]